MKQFNIEFIDGREIPVGTFYCIGRNYANHAKEMGAKVPNEPLIFTKSSQALVNNNSAVVLPEYSNNVHHEVEIVLSIKKDCHNIELNEAEDYIEGIGIGIDLTLRDIQSKLKEGGKPWEVAKSFYGSAPISEFLLYNEIKQTEFNFNLYVNDQLRQEGNTGDMLFDFKYLISFLSKKFFLRAGDCIFTGTPEGVSEIKKGDRATANLESHVQLNVKFE